MAHSNIARDGVCPVGGLVLADTPIELNVGRPVTRLKVRNTGDRPIQVGSHYHFFEVNSFLDFDRAQAFGQRLDIPSGTAVRFEPGDEREVALVPVGGKQRICGFNNLVDDWVGNASEPYRPAIAKAMRLVEERGFCHTPVPVQEKE